MNKQDAIKRLSNLKQQLFQYCGVVKLGLFGSTVRGEATKDSDIDILIDFDSDKETFSNFMNVCDILEKAFGKHKVDVVTHKGLSPFIGNTILNEVEYV